jgi:hypothetical protein
VQTKILCGKEYEKTKKDAKKTLYSLLNSVSKGISLRIGISLRKWIVITGMKKCEIE